MKYPGQLADETSNILVFFGDKIVTELDAGLDAVQACC